jgi:hypothetical protein
MRFASDERFESAFWELYLHEAYRRSGAGPVIHPDLAVTLNGHRAYIEAVRVSATPAKASKQARLTAVEAVLESMPTSNVRLQFSWHRIGETSLATRQLKTELTRWLAGLDYAEIIRTAKASGDCFTGPTLPWRDGDWHLTFTALPVTPRPRTGLIGARGPGRASGVDNVTGLSRVLDAKANKYGTSLDAPLTIAVLSNTDYPTRWYSVA